MARENFDKWYKQARGYERGLDDDPRDPGGRTAEGITQREYDVYRAKLGLPKRDVWKIEEAEIRYLYKTYWDRVRGDELPGGIDFVVADTSLNSGPSQSGRFLQRSLRMNNVDGEIGPATVSAANSALDHDAIVGDFCSRRLAFLQGLKTWKHFGKGWSARVANSLKCGQALASGSVPPDPVVLRALGGAAKASPLSVKQPIIPVSAAQIGNGVGLVGSTASTLAQQAQPLSDIAPIFQKVFIAATVVSLVAGGIAYYLAERKRRTENGEGAVEVDRDADAAAPLAVPFREDGTQASLPLSSPVVRRNVDVSASDETTASAPPVIMAVFATPAPEPSSVSAPSDDDAKRSGGYGGEDGFSTGGGFGDTSTPSTGGGIGD